MRNNISVWNVSNHIVGWLQTYIRKSGAKGFVIGISGGIDSAVTSMLCAETGYPVLCIEMPIHQDPNQVNRAKAHIQQLKRTFKNVSSLEVDLTKTFNTFKQSVDVADVSEATSNFSLANARARLRMTTLYFYAGVYGYLVAGTGNKVEDFGVGFYTKYGDGGVDLSPIGDLMKSEVREIARFFNLNSNIIDAAPTDGLFGDSRSDEDQLGATYDELEWAMQADENGTDFETFTERQREVFKIYKHRNMANKHKMLPIPVCSLEYLI